MKACFPLVIRPAESAPGQVSRQPVELEAKRAHPGSVTLLASSAGKENTNS
jgi:hypothetical protein